MQNYQYGQMRFGLGGGYMTPAVQYTIFANGIVFLLQLLVGNRLIDLFGLHPASVFPGFAIWQFFTYMFLHGGFIHILFNMLILWMFGCEVERHWGSKEFIKYYLICGVGAGLFHLIFNLSSNIPVVGASGAIYGIILAFAMLFPDRPIILFPFFIALKAKYWAIIMAGMQLVFGLLGGGGIAHFAHLGGMVVGYITLKLGWRVSLIRDYASQKRTEWRLRQMIRERQKMLTLREEIDLILDKINDVGYENLTDEEKRKLQSASHSLAEDEQKPVR